MVIYRLGLPYYKEFDNFQFYNSILIFTKQLVYTIDCFSYVQRKEFI